MAKCVRCGRGGMNTLHFAVKLKDKNWICDRCYKELGFSPKEDRTTAKHLRTWDDIKDGADAYYGRISVGADRSPVDRASVSSSVSPRPSAASSADDVNIYSYKVVGVSYDNDAGRDIQQILTRYVRKMHDGDDQYEGMTKKEMKEYLEYDGRVYQYDITDADGDLVAVPFGDGMAVKVMLIDEGVPVHIGWIGAESKDDVLDMLDKMIRADLEIYGGKYKTLTIDDEIETDETPYGARVLIYK